MNKRVTITLEIPMECDECKEWRKPVHYFNESVKKALEEISNAKNIKTRSGKVKTDCESATFKVHVMSIKESYNSFFK